MHTSHHAISRADNAAAIISGKALTYAKVERRSDQGAHLFRSLGMRAGDSMCMLLGTTWHSSRSIGPPSAPGCTSRRFRRS